MDKDILLDIQATLQKLADRVKEETDYPHQKLEQLLQDAIVEAGNAAAREAEHQE